MIALMLADAPLPALQPKMADVFREKATASLDQKQIGRLLSGVGREFDRDGAAASHQYNCF
jgi:hypothetical protein